VRVRAVANPPPAPDLELNLFNEGGFAAAEFDIGFYALVWDEQTCRLTSSAKS
jgi:hypothetical protein